MTENSNSNKTIIWSFVFIFAFLMGMVFSYTPYGTGDRSEYIMTTESIIFDHDLVYDEGVDLKRTLERKPVTLDTPAGLYLIKHTRDGQVRFGLHSFYYPLFSAPFYMAFSLFEKSFSYYGFYFFNALMFFGCVLMGFLYLREKSGKINAVIFSTLFFFLSSSIVYVLWIHSEIFMLFLITAFLFFWRKKKYFISSIFIGIAAGVKLPTLALLLPFWYELAYCKRDIQKAGICLAITVALFSPLLFYNLYYLGTLNPVVHEGFASLKYITPSTVLGSFIDPFYGLVWFYPMVVLGLVNMKPTVKNLLTILSGVIIITAMNGTAHITSHQVGLRYLMLIYPLFLFITGEIRFNVLNRALIALSLLIVAGVVINPINNSLAPQIKKREQFTYLPYKAARYIFHMKDNPEVAYHSSRKVSHNVAILEGDEHLRGDNWMKGDKWLKLLIRQVSKGEIKLVVNGWYKEKPQKFVAVVNGTKKFTFSIAPKTTTTVTIPISGDDIYHYSRRWTGDLVYLDLYSEPWKPSEVIEGNKDPRTLGASLVRLLNNGKILFGEKPAAETNKKPTAVQAGISNDSWTEGNKRTEIDISGVTEGELLLDLGSWSLDKPQKIILSINEKPGVTRLLEPGKSNNIKITVSKDDIITADGGTGAKSIKLGILAEGWVPAEAIAGSEDNRTLGVNLIEVKNNGRVLYQK